VPHDWYEVKSTNTVTGEQRSFYSKTVIIAAGSTESPKLINRSSVYQTLPGDIKELVGFGLTDHPVSAESQAYVTSVGNPRIDISPQDHAKIIFYSKGNPDTNGHVQYPFNIEMNINHEYWHLRNNDPSAGLTPHDPTRTRVDIKFSFANCLDDQNGIHSHANDGYTPYISFKRFSDLNDLLNSRFPAVAGWHRNTADFMTLLNQIRDRIFNEFKDVRVLTGRYGGYPGEQWPFGWGTVHHACGTLRMPWKANRTAAFNQRSVVDEDLKVYGTTGLYVCDMSVLPVSTAANPATDVSGIRSIRKHLATIAASPLADQAAYWNHAETDTSKIETQLVKAGELRSAIVSAGKLLGATNEISKAVHPFISGKNTEAPLFVAAKQFLNAAQSFLVGVKSFAEVCDGMPLAKDTPDIAEASIAAAKQIQTNRTSLKRWTAWCDVKRTAKTAGL